MAIPMEKLFMDICEWAQFIMNFPGMNEVRSEMIGGKATVSANSVYDFSNIRIYLLELCQDMNRRPCKLPSDNLILAKHYFTNWP
jgi:hypothetical protein